MSRRMSTQRVIHGLAIVALAMVALMSIIGSMRQFPGAPAEMRFAPLAGLAIWSLLLWKIWKRPQKWGLGVGIFLLLMIAFQTYLWRLAVLSPHPEIPTETYSASSFALHELPIFVAAVCCIWLRIRHPNELSASATKRA